MNYIKLNRETTIKIDNYNWDHKGKIIEVSEDLNTDYFRILLANKVFATASVVEYNNQNS